MTTPVRLDKPETAHPRPSGPPWVVVPARILALVIVVPLRLVYEVLRGVVRSPLWLGRGLAWLGRGLYRHVLRPIGQGFAWVGRRVWAGLRWLGRGIGAVLSVLGAGLAWTWETLVVLPLRWLFVTVMWGALKLFGRGSGRLGRWIWRTLLVPVGRALNAVLVRPLVAFLKGVWWVISGTGRITWTALAWLLNVLVVIPATALFTYVLAPVGRVLYRAGRVTVRFLAACWHAFAAGVAWAWRTTGRVLYWVARVLFVLPALALWRYLLRPVGMGFAWAWRIIGRGLRWVWRTLLVAPGRWTRDAVLRPVWRGVAATWRALVVDPVRWTRDMARATSREVRLQVRQLFGRA